jgi:uncharacterized repeat protein (TIGR04076 family)
MKRRFMMKVDEAAWKAVQKHFDYTDEEMKVFMENPRNLDVLAKTPLFANKTIVFEVVDAHGCNSQHKKGDKFCFDGAGNLLTKRSPDRICIYALTAASGLIFAAGELLMAGIDPNEMRFKRTGCFDVGVKCGGWGRIVMECRVEDRQR